MALYQSPPNSGGNDGALPTLATYNPNWQAFTNLTPAQIAAFQTLDLIRYVTHRSYLAGISGTSVTLTPVGASSPITLPLATLDTHRLLIIGVRQSVDDLEETAQVPFKDTAGNYYAFAPADIKAIHAGVVGFLGQLVATEAQLVAGIRANPATITTRAQIDAAFAAIAPNSPSANPAMEFVKPPGA